MAESAYSPQLQEIWPQVKPIWSGLDRQHRFALLDVVLHFFVAGGGMVTVDSLVEWLGREKLAIEKSVNHLVSLNFLQDKGKLKDQRFVALNTRHESFPFMKKLIDLLGSTRQGRVHFLKLLANEVE